MERPGPGTDAPGCSVDCRARHASQSWLAWLRQMREPPRRAHARPDRAPEPSWRDRHRSRPRRRHGHRGGPSRDRPRIAWKAQACHPWALRTLAPTSESVDGLAVRLEVISSVVRSVSRVDAPLIPGDMLHRGAPGLHHLRRGAWNEVATPRLDADDVHHGG
jgi:hypothetical protein